MSNRESRKIARERSKGRKTEIIHFESPPRRKLRIREDEVLEVINSGKDKKI